MRSRCGHCGTSLVSVLVSASLRMFCASIRLFMKEARLSQLKDSLPCREERSHCLLFDVFFGAAVEGGAGGLF